MTKILEHEPLARHCRFCVGGPADHFASATSEETLANALRFAREQGLRYFVYSGGSNLFFDDAGYRGLVIQLENGGVQIDPQLRWATVSAGYNLGQLVRAAAGHDLGGIEFLANIPGSVGGAIVGNAGCYGRSISEVVVGAEVYDCQSGERHHVEPEFFEFAYRHSQLKYDQRYVVLSVTLQLTPRGEAEVLAEIGAELESRRRKHPHDAQCAGSFFKNPGSAVPAWQLIQDAGLSELRIGDAQLSPLHANFLVNAGRATSAQIIELAQHVQERVLAHAGVLLTPEVRYVSPEGIQEFGLHGSPGNGR
jgi:UDP-N-acetylmuramate dehydrogenase